MEERAKYRKRYVRSREPIAFRLTEEDVEVLRLLAEYRFLDLRMIQTLRQRGIVALRDRMRRMFHGGLVDRPRSQMSYLAKPAPMTYALSNKGADVLAERGLLEPGKVNWTKKNAALGRVYLQHTLMVSRFRSMLTAALRLRTNAGLARWRQGPEAKGETWVDGRRVAMVPDGLFTLENGEYLLHYCLEADRSTMPAGSRYLAKLRAYWNWYREGGHRRAWGVEAAFRVLSLTTSKKRRDTLRALTREVDGGGRAGAMFLFGWEGDFDLVRPETVLGEMWLCGVESCNGRHRLME